MLGGLERKAYALPGETFANGMFWALYEAVQTIIPEVCRIICGYALENVFMKCIENVHDRYSPLVIKQLHGKSVITLESGLGIEHYGIVGLRPLPDTNAASFTADIELQKYAPYLLTVGVTHSTRTFNNSCFPFDIDDWAAITAVTFVYGWGGERTGYWSAIGSDRLRHIPIASAATLSALNYSESFNPVSGWNENPERERELLPLRFSVTIRYDYTSENIIATISYSDSVSLQISIAPQNPTKISKMLPYVSFRAQNDGPPRISISSPS